MINFEAHRLLLETKEETDLKFIHFSYYADYFQKYFLD